MDGMKEFSKRFFVGFIIMAVLAFSILISKWIMFLSTVFPTSNIKVEIINFEKKNVTIYIVTQNYGLNNQHAQTIISQNNVSLDNISVNQEKDIVIEGVDHLYYKVYQPDSILVICPQWNPKQNVISNIKNINVHVIGLPVGLNKNELINKNFVEISFE